MKSEYESSGKKPDIALLDICGGKTKVKYNDLIELKYLKKSEASEAAIESKRVEAFTQMQKYLKLKEFEWTEYNDSKERQWRKGGIKAYQRILSDEIKVSVIPAKTKKKTVRKVVGTTLAASICLLFILGGILYASPSLAADMPFIGDIFKILQERRDTLPYPSKDLTAYDKIAENSEKVQGAHAEDAGITVEIRDVYCDDIPWSANMTINDITGLGTPIQLVKSAEENAFIYLARISAVGCFPDDMFPDSLDIRINFNGVGISKRMWFP